MRACLNAGWAEPWFANPLKPDWQVCRLTAAGRTLAEAADEGADDGEDNGGDGEPPDPLEAAETVEDILDVLREETSLDDADDPAATLEPDPDPPADLDGEPKLF